MDANTVFLILQLLLFLLFVAVIIVGDVYLTYMVFNSSSYTCENFANPSTTTKQTPVKQTNTSTTTTIAKSSYSPCYNLSTAQLGFAKFMNVMFWVLFGVVTLGSIYMLYSYLGDNEVLFIFAIAILITMSVFIIVGGVFLTQYVFNGSSKNCYLSNTSSTSTQYCYNINDIKLTFTKIAVVFNWFYSIATILTVGAFIYQINLG